MKIQCRGVLTLLIVMMLAFASGCERTPEDLEPWRNAEGGYEKIAGWVASPEESMAVRQKGLQILIEERQVNEVGQLLDKMEDAATKAALVDGVMPTVQAMWDAQDQPKMTEEVKEKGGRIAVGDSKTVVAKDAAYFLQPHAQGETKAKLEAMLAAWMAEDQDLRTQLGNTTVGQVLPRAGKAGLEAMVKWLGATQKPANVQRQVMQHTKDDEIMGALAEVLVKRANEEMPELSNQLEVAILENPSKTLVPFLEKAIQNDQLSGKVIDGFTDALVRIQGDKATPFLSKLVGEESGLKRWVPAQRMIEVRGKAGILAAANSLPLEYEAYADEDVKERVEVFCNFVSTEMAAQKVDGLEDIFGRALASNRWPAQMVGLKCVEVAKMSALKPKVEALTSSKTAVVSWGKDKDRTTIGKIAKDVAAKL